VRVRYWQRTGGRVLGGGAGAQLLDGGVRSGDLLPLWRTRSLSASDPL